MGQTLTNGIYLPDEGEVRCYDGLASNWTTLDSVVGGYRAHVANENIHITSEERSKWDTGVTQAYVLRYASVSLTALGTVAFSALDNTDNIKIGDKVLDSEGKLFALTAVNTESSTATLSALLIDLSKDSDLSNYYTKNETDTRLNGKADASALTAHTGDTTIHVTSADKQAWDTVTNKANDADVMHLTGNEIVGGQKTLENLLPLKGEFLGTEASNNGRTLLYFIANRDTQNQSGIYLTKFRQNKAQGAMSGNDIAYLSFDCLENSVRTNNGLRINFLNFVEDIPQRFILWSAISEKLLGAVGAPWSNVFTDKINSLNPGALSLPDLSNGIDISGYITVTGGNKESLYTPLSDGWISVALTRSGGASMAVMLKQGNFASSGHNIAQENGTTTCNAMLPVKGGVQVSINSALADGIAFAYFYPCQGNI